jgi:hypothetical protein
VPISLELSLDVSASLAVGSFVRLPLQAFTKNKAQLSTKMVIFFIFHPFLFTRLKIPFCPFSLKAVSVMA